MVPISFQNTTLYFTCRLKLWYQLSFQSLSAVFTVSVAIPIVTFPFFYIVQQKTAKQVQYYTVTDGLLINLFSMLAKNIMKIILLRRTE